MSKRSAMLQGGTDDVVAVVPILKRPISWHAKCLAVMQLLFRRIAHAQIDQTAAALAYYAILSLFPTALMVINLLPAFGLHFATIRTVLSQLMPENVLATVDPVLHDLAAHASTTWLGIGTILTIWAASLGIASLKNAYNRAYGLQHNVQNFFVSRIVAMVMMILLIVAVAGAMIAFAFGQQFLQWLTDQFDLPTHWLNVFLTWRWPVTVTILGVALLIVDYFLPNVRMRFWTVGIGVVFTAAGWLGLSQVFSLYMAYFGKTFSTYGTLGAFIVLLLWLFFSSAIMIIGVILNAVVHEMMYGPAEPTPGKFYDFGRYVMRRLQSE